MRRVPLRHTLLAFVALAAFAAGGCSRDADGAERGLSEADLADEIAQRIEIRESPAIFSAFAFLNAAGYDGEEPETMHPVRRAIRGAVTRRVPDAMFDRASTYYAERAAVGLADYATVALATSGPPNFTPGAVWVDRLSSQARFKPLAGFASLLAAFHKSYPADSVYRLQQTAYRAYIVDYTAVVRREVASAVRYARIRERSELSGFGEHGRVVVIPNLLMAHHAAFTVTLDTTSYVIQGPERVVGFDPHEFIHAMTHRAAFDAATYATQHRKAAALYAAYAKSARTPVYASLAAFIDECLVRAISLRYAGMRDEAREQQQAAMAASAASEGLTLVPYFFEQLKSYENQREALAAYYPRLFDHLDAAREQARWRDTIGKRG